MTEVKLLLPGGHGSSYSGYGMQQQTQPPVQPAAGSGGYSSYGGQSQGYEQNSNYQSSNYGQPPTSNYGGQQASTYGSQPSANYSALQPQGNYGGPPPQGNYGGPPSGGNYGGPQGPNYGAPPPPSNGNYGGQGGGFNSGLGMAPPPQSAPPGFGGMHGQPKNQLSAPTHRAAGLKVSSYRRDQGRGYNKEDGSGNYGGSRFDGDSRGGNGDRFRGESSDLVMQEDTIFVSGMPANATEENIKEHFGSIGIIKMDKRTQRPKIWMYKDKATGRMKGECTVTFDDPFTAKSRWQRDQRAVTNADGVALVARPEIVVLAVVGVVVVVVEAVVVAVAAAVVEEGVEAEVIEALTVVVVLLVVGVVIAVVEIVMVLQVVVEDVQVIGDVLYQVVEITTLLGATAVIGVMSPSLLERVVMMIVEVVEVETVEVSGVDSVDVEIVEDSEAVVVTVAEEAASEAVVAMEIVMETAILVAQ
ncbi:RNA-binding protein cabeza-like [Homarus americanus]|uniref:RNA-binding protein cabeza-like n=1 Tax=Homarus americanus TaxID=6706 RepID=A0A8J5TIA1_HOMAM|nr:RNA-binding protein cabeza-like [Homarus americanus]